MIKALLMNMMDNVAVTLQPAPTGSEITVINDGDIRAKIISKREIPFGHKIAVSEIMRGDDVMKYGEIIGTATQNIEKGDHVHVHNLKSIRGSADRRQTG